MPAEGGGRAPHRPIAMTSPSPAARRALRLRLRAHRGPGPMLASGAATRRVAAIAVAAAGVAGVACSAEPKEDAGYVWRLPPGFPEPVVPADNPMSPAKVELGRRLFHDPRLSRTGTLSCATCHEPRRAFSDGRPRSAGATGEEHRRNAPSLANVAYLPSLTWANPGLRSLERQVVTPLFGERPVEHGLAGQDDALAMLLQDDADYARLVPSRRRGRPHPCGPRRRAPVFLGAGPLRELPRRAAPRRRVARDRRRRPRPGGAARRRPLRGDGTPRGSRPLPRALSSQRGAHRALLSRRARRGPGGRAHGRRRAGAASGGRRAPV